jgi:hypothetical protein
MSSPGPCAGPPAFLGEPDERRRDEAMTDEQRTAIKCCVSMIVLSVAVFVAVWLCGQ